MKRSELTVENFKFDFVLAREYPYTKSDIVNMIKKGAKVVLHPVEKCFSTDWKGLHIHDQLLEIFNGESSIMMFREVTRVPNGTARQRIFAMCGSQWD